MQLIRSTGCYPVPLEERGFLSTLAEPESELLDRILQVARPETAVNKAMAQHFVVLPIYHHLEL